MSMMDIDVGTIRRTLEELGRKADELRRHL